MKPENGMNPEITTYFSLEEYVNKIRLNDKVLFHLEDTNISFDKYMKNLLQYDDEQIIHYWISSLTRELEYSNMIENHFINPEEILKNNVYFNNLQMNHNRIKQLHKFMMEFDENIYNKEDYRSIGEEVNVSTINEKGEETIFWKGAQGEDVKKFMDDFIKIYKEQSLSQIYSNPFLKSALVSLLFVRIHPFMDGNGRTSRVIYNIKFTEFVNKMFGCNLKLCPLNISQNINLYKSEYSQTIDNIYFDLKHDCNEEINDWFNFILNRVDETLFYNTNKLENYMKRLEQEKRYTEVMENQVGKMNLVKVRRQFK